MPDDKVWEDIRRAYEHSSLAVKEIQATYNITPAQMQARRKAENWILRNSLAAMHAANAASRAANKAADANGDDAVQTTATSTPSRSSAQARRKPPNRKAPTSADRKAVIARLSSAIDNKLITLEARMERELATIDDIDDTSAADIERDIRAIGQLIKNLEQATAHEATANTKGPSSSRRPAGRKRGGDASATELADAADRSRRELLDRLQRLVDVAQKDASENPGGAGAQ